MANDVARKSDRVGERRQNRSAIFDPVRIKQADRIPDE